MGEGGKEKRVGEKRGRGRGRGKWRVVKERREEEGEGLCEGGGNKM